MPREKRLQLMEVAGIPKLLKLSGLSRKGGPDNGPLSPLINEGQQHIESVIDSFEAHAISCYAPETRSTSVVEPQGAVFKWVDSEGKVHFGDKPKVKGAEDLSSRYKMEKQ